VQAGQRYRTRGYVPVAFENPYWPWSWKTPVALDPPDRPVDEDGVFQEIRDGRTYDHPMFQAWYAILLLNGYWRTGDQRYLDRARANVERVIGQAVPYAGADFYPYPFDFALHGDPSDVMTAPWYSAIAQGRVLAALVRMHHFTREDRYGALADRAFRSFLVPHGPGHPWVTWIDDHGLLWLEEYPKEPPMAVLNGHITAALGVREYYEHVADPVLKAQALRVFDGAVSTVRERVMEFRRPGGPSVYGLRRCYPTTAYHPLHVEQLGWLNRFTEDQILLRRGRGPRLRLAAPRALTPPSSSGAAAAGATARTVHIPASAPAGAPAHCGERLVAVRPSRSPPSACGRWRRSPRR